METDRRAIIHGELRKLLRDDIGDDISDTPIAELGVDSLDFFDLLSQLEDAHGIDIPIEHLDENVTLNSLVAAAEQAVRR